jgi:SAM-dependent methyltransferase
VKICLRNFLLPEPVADFGSLQVEGRENIDMRPLFPGKWFIGSDFRAGAGVDVVGDLEQLGLADESLGTVLCLDTLEHVEDPRAAMSEMYRVLAPGGILIMTSVFDFPIHSFPNDYWRFTPEGFRSLLKPFPTCFAGSYGLRPESPRTVVGIGLKGQTMNPAFAHDYANWQKWYIAISEAEMRKSSELPAHPSGDHG